MIKAEDAKFHPADSDKPNWAETNYFGFYSVDPILNCGVYTLFRPNLGCVNSTICLNGKMAVSPWEADYNDLQAHVAIPDPRNLEDYSLSNGLHVTCLDPNMAWDIKFDDGEGTTIDVRYDSLMPPYDIHDPDMDPMVAGKTQEGEFAWGTAYNGHFDQTGHIRGEVVVRGKRHAIDCVSTMDHSWGPRPERGAPNMSWLHAHFSDDLAMHAIFEFGQDPNGTDLKLSHGYILEKGEVFGLKAGTGRTVRLSDRYADTVELRLTDKADRVWELSGEAMTTFPWQCWPNMVAFNVLARWQCNGLEGYGEIMDFFEVPLLTRLNSNAATAAASERKA